MKVSIIGNVLNGLQTNEIKSIEKNKLQLNHFYRKKAMESMNMSTSDNNIPDQNNTNGDKNTAVNNNNSIKSTSKY